jgi:hypothetical protein
MVSLVRLMQMATEASFQSFLLVLLGHGILRRDQHLLQPFVQKKGWGLAGEIGLGGFVAPRTKWNRILAKGITSVIDKDRSRAILEGFLVGRIAHLPLGSLLQQISTMNHVEALLVLDLEKKSKAISSGKCKLLGFDKLCTLM